LGPQFCTQPWLGWIPDDLSGCPPLCGEPPRRHAGVRRRRDVQAARGIRRLGRPTTGSHRC